MLRPNCSRLGHLFASVLFTLIVLSLNLSVLHAEEPAAEPASADAAPSEASPSDSPTPAEPVPAEAAPAEPALTIDPFIVPAGTDQLVLEGKILYFEDPEGKLHISEVSADAFQSKFKPTPDSVPNFGFTTSAFWLRVDIANQSETMLWVLEASYAALDDVQLYQKSAEGDFKKQQAGDNVPFAGRYWPHRYSNFSVEIWEGDTAPIYLRVQTDGSVKIPLSLYSERAFGTKSMDELFTLGLYFGVILVMIVFTAFLFIPLRDSTYLHYIGFLLCFSLFMASLNGLAFQKLWPDTPPLNNATLLVYLFGLAFFGAEFTRRFNECETYLPKLNRALQIVGTIGLVMAVAQFVMPYSKMVKVGVVVVVIFCAMNIVTGVMAIKAGYRPARFFLIAWFCFMAGAIAYALALAGQAPVNALTENGVLIGSAMEVTLLALALVDRFQFQFEANNQA